MQMNIMLFYFIILKMQNFAAMVHAIEGVKNNVTP